MKGRSKKIIAMLGVAVMLVGQCSAVLAEEATDSAEVIEASEIGIEEVSTEENATEESKTESVVETESVAETEVETNATEETTTEVSTDEVETEALEYLPMLLAEDAGTEESTTTELLPVTAYWDEDFPGLFEFDNPNTVEVMVYEELLYDGEFVMAGWNTYDPGEGSGWFFNCESIKESGDYVVKTYVFPSDITMGEMYESLDTCEYTSSTEVYSYTYPGVTLPTVTGIEFSSTGIVTWDLIDSEYVWQYSVSLFDVTDGGKERICGEGVYPEYDTNFSVDFLDYISEGREYAVTIIAYSNNINEIYNSAESELVYLSDDGIVEEVNNTLTEITGSLSEDSSADEVTAAVADVKASFSDTQEKRELQLAMQTNSDTIAEIEKLEALYEEAAGVSTSVTVADEAGVDASKIKLLGASLNASAGEVNFDVGVPDEETVEELLGKRTLLNPVCFSMNLTGADVNSTNLAVPVTITMPIPEGINESRLCVIHYSADGSAETVALRKNGDGTVSFTITHFSEFVFGEVEETSNNISSSSSSGSSSSKKVEKPWVPTTPDEKERYSYFGREKLKYIVGTEGGYKAELVNVMQGRLFFDAVDAAKGDYTIARTYNVEIDGKLVYETAMPAMFVLDIPTEYQAAGRDYKMVCVCKGGEVVILDDLDTVPETISFLTNKFYAFALIYKDIVVTE